MASTGFGLPEGHAKRPQESIGFPPFQDGEGQEATIGVVRRIGDEVGRTLPPGEGLRIRPEHREALRAGGTGGQVDDVPVRAPPSARWAMKKFMISPEQGAESSLVCATSPELASQTGRYYDVGGRERRPSRLADDSTLATELWAKSAEWTGVPD